MPDQPVLAAVPSRAEIVVDLDAVRHNVARLREIVAPAEVMVVVKADGYGHGASQVARAAREAGAAWLGVATTDEAVALREAGDEGPLLCWLAAPGDDYRPAIGRGVTLTAYDAGQLAAIADAATEVRPSTPVDVQLKVDTGLHRGGVAPEDWDAVVALAVRLVAEGRVRITGTWSHLACADTPDHPANAAQEAALLDAVDKARAGGLDPGALHLANSAGALTRPSARFDLVRVGLAAYGLNPAPTALGPDAWAALDLRPAMTVQGRLVLVRTVPPGGGVSYGHTFVAERELRAGLVPIGYADGLPRHASGRPAGPAEVLVRGRRGAVLGRVCMDQVMVEVPADARGGDEFVLFGPGDHGEPTAQEWAEAAETISYEIVTRMGGRLTRRYTGADMGADTGAGA